VNILVTGCAGFIGFSFIDFSLRKKVKSKIIGIDNLNNYYDIKLKNKRLDILKKYKNFKFVKCDLLNIKKINNLVKKNNIKIIIHLAAQAGVRYSIFNPKVYFDSNIAGFFNILQISKNNKIKHFIFASTSSVYGKQKKFPINEDFNTNEPLSFYAATKKSNEILAYSYSSIYKLKCTGLRFFTVFGPYGRPDMAIYKWSEALFNKGTIELYNRGNHFRDFTFIDDVNKYISKIINKPSREKTPFQIFNVGNSKPHKITKILNFLKRSYKKSTKIINKPLQIGDVVKTHASNKKISKKTGYTANTDIFYGLNKFQKWFRNYKDVK